MDKKYGQGKELRDVDIMIPAINWDDYEYLKTHASVYFDHVRKAHEAGYTAEEIYATVKARAVERAIADRCRGAALHLESLAD